MLYLYIYKYEIASSDRTTTWPHCVCVEGMVQWPSGCGMGKVFSRPRLDYWLCHTFTCSLSCVDFCFQIDHVCLYFAGIIVIQTVSNPKKIRQSFANISAPTQQSYNI